MVLFPERLPFLCVTVTQSSRRRPPRCSAVSVAWSTAELSSTFYVTVLNVCLLFQAAMCYVHVTALVAEYLTRKGEKCQASSLSIVGSEDGCVRTVVGTLANSQLTGND